MHGVAVGDVEVRSFEGDGVASCRAEGDDDVTTQLAGRSGDDDRV